MSSGKWGTWAFLAPEDAAAQSAARARVGHATSQFGAAHPHLIALPDVIVPLSRGAGVAAQTAYALLDADVIIADVTGARPEVVFMLGARDLVEKRLTIALHEGDPDPALRQVFGERLISFAPNDPALPKSVVDLIARDVAVTSDSLTSEVRLRLGSYSVSPKSRPLSKAENALAPALQGPWKVVRKDQTRSTAEIDLWWGDIAEIVDGDNIHAIVNSENTYFEMGRIHDRGLSAAIRFLGAKWYGSDRCDDFIYRELLARVERRPADPGTAIVTPSGQLKNQGIHAIAHVASVRPSGKAARGYEPVEDLGGCVCSVLEKLEDVFPLKGKITASPTVLFPLIGTGNASGDARTISRQVINAVVEYIDKTPESRLGKILISAYTNTDLQHCAGVIAWLRDRQRIVK